MPAILAAPSLAVVTHVDDAKPACGGALALTFHRTEARPQA
jgi:hypothetical protein